MSVSNFPEELLIEILKRLPVKSICRFIVVSKVWHALITSACFISTHLHHTLSNVANGQQRTSLLIGEEESCSLLGDGIEKLKLSFDGYASVVGTSNGLVCLAGNRGEIILFNLSIRRSFMLPQVSIIKRYVVLGFGSDLESGDYKVVMLVYPNLTLRDLCNGMPYTPEVEVYSLKRRMWKRLVQPSVSCLIMPISKTQVLMNGCVHWLATQRQASGFTNLILIFDVADELFVEIILPDELRIAHQLHLCCNLIEKCLTVIKYNNDMDVKSCSIWLMKEYGNVESWTITYSFDLVEGMKRVIGVLGDGEFLVTMGENEGVSYGIKTSTIKEIGLSVSNFGFLVDRYVESLILFGEKKQKSNVFLLQN